MYHTLIQYVTFSGLFCFADKESEAAFKRLAAGYQKTNHGCYSSAVMNKTHADKFELAREGRNDLPNKIVIKEEYRGLYYENVKQEFQQCN